MPLVPMKKLLNEAEKGKYAVGAFNVANMEMIMGVMRAAEELRSPVILQVAERRLEYSPLHLIGPMMVAAATAAKVPTAVNFDHGQTLETIQQALAIGFSSVMIDGSQYPLDENIRITRTVCEEAARYGASMEGEVGAIGGNEGGDAAVIYTDVNQAARFFEATGVDALAVAIGNAHGLYHGIPHLNFDVLGQVRRRISVPLVLHGGTGLSEQDFHKSIRMGIRKINVATAIFNSAEEHVYQMYQEGSPRSYFRLHEQEVVGAYETSKRHIQWFGCAGWV